MKRFYTLYVFVSVILNAQIQVHPITRTNYDSTIVANDTLIQNVITFSKTFMGQPKLTSINVVNNNYQPVYSGNWDSGAWFRGYYTDFENNLQKFYNLDPTISQTKYWSAHPQARHTGKQVRAMIHYDNYYSNADNFETIKLGLGYLISQIQPNGGYIYWYTRESQDAFEQNDNVTANSQNRTHIYETANALAALCEGYLYLNKNNISQPPNLYEKIVLAADNIYRKTVNDSLNITVPDPDSPYYNADYSSPNYIALGLWALSKAYKITNDCRYLERIMELDNWLVTHQYYNPNNIADICNGTWKYGEEYLEDANGPKVYHDTRMVYHAIILRGLVESLDCIPKSNTIRNNLSQIIKKAVNHVIDYRVDYTNNNGSFGGISDFYSNSNCQELDSTKIHHQYYYADDVIESMSLLAYYTRFDGENFVPVETQNLKKLLNIISAYTQDRINPNNTNNQGIYDSVIYMPSLAYYLDYTKAINNNTKVFAVDNTNFFDSEKTSKPVSLDFDHDSIKNEIAYFSTNGDKTFLNVAKVANDGTIFSVKKVWESVGYPISMFSDRIVSGDFDSDGQFDDIAVICDFGGGETRIHVFKGTGTGFDYTGPNGYWQVSSGYDANLIGDRVVSGDFDNDGKHNDIAVLYKYGNGAVIHIFQGNISNFVYIGGATGFWNDSAYSCDNIIGNIVSGDFDNDGKFDDIAVFSKVNTTETKINVFKSTGSSFTSAEWWSNSGYPFAQMDHRIVSGDFDGDNTENDIALISETNPGQSNLHIFQGNTTSFNYLGATSNYWNSTSYDSQKIKGKVVGFHTGTNNKSDIFAMYNVPNKDSKLQVFKNNMTSTPQNFVLKEISDWWNNKCEGYIYQEEASVSNIEQMSNKIAKGGTAKNTAEIKIYKDSDSFEILSHNKIKNVQVFDFSGRLIQQYENVSSTRFRFNLLKQGNYIVKVTDMNNKISTKKILN